MAEPKQKRSKARTRRAFAQKTIHPQAVGKCPNCGKPVPTHRRCAACVVTN
ncbi:MAG: 50S ribosomal protein L32 [bacterium]|nr:50S ribosomal protein L32 [bacterium]